MFSSHRFHQQIAGVFAILHRQEQSYLDAAPPPRLLPPMSAREDEETEIDLREQCLSP